MSLKTTMMALTALGAMAASGTATAAVLYQNGTPSGAITGVNVGYDNEVANSFVLSQAATVTGINFTSWDYPNSRLTGIGYAIEATPTVPISLTSVPINLSTYLFTQQPNGYIIDEDSFSTTPVTLQAGIYYLVLGSATGNGGGYWDENNGPSTSYGPFGQFAGQSETFQVIGTPVSAVPEPSTWAIMTVGIGGIGLVLRRAKTPGLQA